ncbi:hypothetical protein [Herbidospora sp. RD11066]
MSIGRKPVTRAIVAFGAGLALMHGPASAPASAASSIVATHAITVPGMVKHVITVRLPMSRQDAEGYIYWGAKIKIDCYGEDVVSDPKLVNVPGTFKGAAERNRYFSGVPRPDPYPPGFGVLTATDEGVVLTTLDLYEKGGAGELNEDIGLGTLQDEIYCRATWVDADGYTLTDKTNVVTGYF